MRYVILLPTSRSNLRVGVEAKNYVVGKTETLTQLWIRFRQIDDHDGIEVEDSLFDANSFKAEKYFQHSPYEHAHQGEDDLAQWMFKKVRILCWVATHPGNLKKKAVHVLRTWGKR
ncbi:unnamed protein product [Cyprideis torosa]|uniref:Uncharacterized protein n=1 Tax=Cyprideis torosa TaxID=163714 RepID=A0A7R8WFQ6_9CRUS|nr:unnamed protein product [Cyprideis torosa]CAG0892129.1 unnamed protein product [Cyprideis torosa]